MTPWIHHGKMIYVSTLIHFVEPRPTPGLDGTLLFSILLISSLFLSTQYSLLPLPLVITRSQFRLTNYELQSYSGILISLDMMKWNLWSRNVFLEFYVLYLFLSFLNVTVLGLQGVLFTNSQNFYPRRLDDGILNIIITTNMLF